MSQRIESPDQETVDVPVLPWDQVVQWLDRRWHPGEHWSIFGRTGSGKTYQLVHGLLPLWTRSRVLIVDVKHDKGTMDPIGHVVTKKPHAGDKLPFRVREWTRGRDHPSWDQDPEWYKLQPRAHRWHPDRARQRSRESQVRADVGYALDQAFHEGDWVIVVDDVVTVADKKPPNLDLGDLLARIWRDGRDRGITMIAATQAPAFAPAAMYDQPTFVSFGRTADVRRQIRLGEIGGDRELIEAILPELQGHETLIMDLANDHALVTEVA